MSLPVLFPVSLTFSLLVGGFVSAVSAEEAPETSQQGRFQATDKSLGQYECPDWFRDAKLGIWAVWGPAAVPKEGDWYGRRMYLSNEQDKETGEAKGANTAYTHHLENYGHPSDIGYKDIIPLWKAERWDPDRLMRLYKKAGAKYFTMIAMHHDNFDCWDSKFQRWNSVKMGPKRDIAAEWQGAARKHGLRFGMSEHLAASWWFFSASKGADVEGPKAGVPYDGSNPEFSDLYWSGNEKPDFNYYSTEVPESFKQTWFNRVMDLIDRYHPDLLYSDSPLPFADEYGRRMVAHYYNDSLSRNGGQLEAVFNCKEESQGRWVRDLERGVMPGIHAEPWQTDTCVGGWYYKTGQRYKSSGLVIRMLADIVSKNGNLLLNFPPRPDGTLDPDEERILSDMAEWMAINGESIFGTRPWKVFGEGPSKAVEGGNFNEASLAYTADDIRYTRSKDGSTVYAIVLGEPQKTILLKSLVGAEIKRVELLGSEQEVEWRMNSEGLELKPFSLWPCRDVVVYKLRISKS